MFWTTALTDVAAAQAAKQLLYLAFVLFGDHRDDCVRYVVSLNLKRQSHALGPI